MDIEIDKKTKLRLLCYLPISALGFTYLVLPRNAGIGVLVFAVIQLACLYFIAPRKKPLLMFIPLFILALNSFISANAMWRVPNLFIALALYGVMTLMMAGRFSPSEKSLKLCIRLFKCLFNPFRYYAEPVKWCFDANRDSGKQNAKTVLRLLAAIGISLPCLVVLLALLSSADAIFSESLSEFLRAFLRVISVNVFAKTLFGFFVGFYLCGLFYSIYRQKEEKTGERKKKSGDLLILNILLISILSVYTIFVVIQFKYLFANGSELPYGLSYTYYARRGFFELLFLTGLNITLILITTWLTEGRTGRWARFTKVLSCYLCAVTFVLLISSFYRMWLYNADDGLTRLRFLVFGFLIFESIGLLFTFAHIIVPRFNIIAVYVCIALVYYLALNVVPMDSIIAKDQIDRYFETGRGGVAYVTTLSVDAAPQVARLVDVDDPMIKYEIDSYFEHVSRHYAELVPRWQRWNLSVSRFKSLQAVKE